jgi:signal transduction histidine kinase
MHKSLYWKLTLAFVLVAFTTAGLVALFIRVTSPYELEQLIIDQERSSLVKALSSYYQSKGSWDGIAPLWEQLQSIELTEITNTAENPESSDEKLGRDYGEDDLFGLADMRGIVIVPADPQFPPGSKIPPQMIKAGRPVLVGGNPVGIVLTSNRVPEFDPEEALYLQRTNRALLLAVFIALFVALLIGIVLARTLTQPLQTLKQAAQNIAQGQLEQQVAVSSQDELGQLAAAFNRMSQEVSRVNQSRRQMTADIAHDLRTPLTVISGYIESMRDGVLKPTPQRYSLIYAEIERLQRLVEDLRMLSLADAGELSLNLQQVPSKNLLNRAAALFQPLAEQKNVTILVDANGNSPDILVDEERMMQVLGNLLTNALRYTPSGGMITLSGNTKEDKVDITVQDTGMGIAPEDLPWVFERFHRVEKSRHAENGESGLGLAIVKALIESQGGSAWAESIPRAGTTIHLILPHPKAKGREPVSNLLYN